MSYSERDWDYMVPPTLEEWKRMRITAPLTWGPNHYDKGAPEEGAATRKASHMRSSWNLGESASDNARRQAEYRERRKSS